MRLRGLLLGVALLPINAFWLAHMELGTGSEGRPNTAGPYPTTFSLFANAVSLLVAVVLLNALASRLLRRELFSPAEILASYVMVNIGSAILSIDFVDVLLPIMTHPARYATPENGWDRLFIPYIPRWLGVWDPVAIRGWYEGGVSPYRWEIIGPWLKPLAAWGFFALVLLGTMLCLAAILRRQWTEHEKLSYPITILPLEVAQPGSGLARNRLLWLGIAIPALIQLVNGLNVYFPTVPMVRVKLLDLSPYFRNPPWNAMGWTPVSFYPFGIGLGYLLPLDLLFSCWFFYWFWKAERVVSALFGWLSFSPRWPFVNEQCWGAYAQIAVFGVWLGRRHLGRVFASIRRPELQDAGEPLPYRVAALGLIAGFVGWMVFLLAAGMSWWLAALSFAVYAVVIVAAMRMRAELGPPAHDLHYGGPDSILSAAIGTRNLGAADLTILAHFWWFNRAYRSLAIAHDLEGFRLAQRSGSEPRAFVTPLLVATVLGLLCAFWAYLHIGYTRGLEAKTSTFLPWFGWEAFNRLDGWLRARQPADWLAGAAIGVAFTFCSWLFGMRMRFPWWSLHPLGLAISGSYSMNTLWMPLLIAWALKSLTVRYFGHASYRRFLPFFLGLILGDYLCGCTWPLIGWIIGQPAYSFQQ